MAKHYDVIRNLGAEVIAVALSKPEVVREYLKERPWPFPVLCDPNRTAYRQFGLGRVSWTSFLRPSVIARYLRIMFGGWLPRRPKAGEDPLQLGGDFVLDEERNLIYAYRNRVATDRPPVELLLKLLSVH